MSPADSADTPGTDARVFVVDAIDVRPGQVGTVRAAYLASYAPGACTRGMTLVHDWISPPLLIEERGQRLTFVWSVDGTPGWWQMRLTASFDPEVKAFWDSLLPLIEGRERSFHETAVRHV